MTTLVGFTLARPASAPSVAVGSASGGLTASSVYQYKVTYSSQYGETDGNASAASLTVTSPGSVNLTNIPRSPDTNTIKRNIYRTAAGGSSFFLLATINDNITTTFTDTTADGSLSSTALPTANTAHSRQVLFGDIKLSRPTTYSVEATITATSGGGQANAYQLSNEYNFVSVAAASGDSVRLPALNSNLIGVRVVIANDGANSINVFPFTGQDASAGTNTAVAVAATARAEFVARSATVWSKVR